MVPSVKGYCLALDLIFFLTGVDLARNKFMKMQ